MLVSEKAERLSNLKKALARETEFYKNVSAKPKLLQDILKQEQFWVDAEDDKAILDGCMALHEISCLFAQLREAEINRESFYQILQEYINEIEEDMKDKKNKIDKLMEEICNDYTKYFKVNGGELNFIFDSLKIKYKIINFLISDGD